MKLIELLYFLISFEELNLTENEMIIHSSQLWLVILWNTSKIHDDMLTVLLGFGMIMQIRYIYSQMSVLIMYIL